MHLHIKALTIFPQTHPSTHFSGPGPVEGKCWFTTGHGTHSFWSLFLMGSDLLAERAITNSSWAHSN